METKMIQDEIKSFIQNLYKYLVAEEIYTTGLLVKKHSNNLQTQGEFSFLKSTTPWQEFLSLEQLQSQHKTLLQCVNKDIADLINTSKDWPIQIVKAEEIKDRIHLFIDRHSAIRTAFQTALNNYQELLQRINTETTVVKIDPYCTESDSVTFLRLKRLSEVVRNLYIIRTYPEIQDLIIVVTWGSGYDYLFYDCSLIDVQMVSCGPVLNARTRLKENAITASEYIRIRQEELTLIAHHKFGLRASTDEKWKDCIAHLGESATTFELLQTKCSSAVKIHFEGSDGPSKGVAFILYNCARLETMIRTFNEKVEEGIYPALPSMENTDFSLLTDEGEWSLIFTYIMGLPLALENSASINQDLKRQKYEDSCGWCNFRPHLVCHFLSNMVKAFSQYYRRVKILTEPRKHLLPVLFARIHMLIILNNTLDICLKILNIKSVSQM